MLILKNKRETLFLLRNIKKKSLKFCAAGLCDPLKQYFKSLEESFLK